MQVPADLPDEIGSETVQYIAWKMLSTQYRIQADALLVVVKALESDTTVVCAAAALLLQHARGVTKEVRKQATQTILKILTDETLSGRPLDPPDYSKIWRLDDVLFETLKILAE